MFDSHWQVVLEGLERSSKELLAELEAALGRLEAIHQELEAPSSFDPEALESLAELESCWTGMQKAHFDVPRQKVERARLIPQTVEAFRTFRRGLDGLARRSPRILQLTGQELSATLSPAAGRKPWMLAFSRGERPLAMSPALVQGWHRETEAFLTLAGTMLAALCDGVSSLLRRWRRLSAISGLGWNANGGVPDCQVSTDLLLPIGTDPQVVLKIGYEAAYSSPYLLRSKPVVVLLSDQFDQMPYLRVRIKPYVFDHRYEPRLMSDITMRAKQELLARGLLASWGTNR